MAILVTGASGMLGRVLSERLRKTEKVLGVSRRDADGLLSCDLSDAAQVRRLFDAHPVDFVVNSAAYSDVDGCELDPALAHAANTLGPKNLSEICGARKIPWLHISTDYVFDGRKREPYKEDDATGPVNIYGLTKWVGEFYAQHSASPCAVVRTSWLFGGPNPKNFVEAVAARLCKESRVEVLDDQTDAPTSVADLSVAIERMMAFMRKEALGRRWNETFHVCNTGGATRLEMTEKMRDFLGRKEVRVEKADRSRITNRVAIRPAYAVMSNERFTRTFGMTMRPWQESLREYVQKGLSCAS